MGVIVIAAYRPHEGKENALRECLKGHLDTLRKEGLATERESIVMRAEDGTHLEVFEWVSEEAIGKAHTNPAVLRMWEEFGAACEYVSLSTLPESHQMFATFPSVEI